jgi:hypothetical protein
MCVRTSGSVAWTWSTRADFLMYLTRYEALLGVLSLESYNADAQFQIAKEFYEDTL